MSEELNNEIVNEVNSVEQTEEQATQPAPQPEQSTLSQIMGLATFRAFNPTSNSKGGSNTPSIGLVYTHRNGKRLSVSNALFDLLGKPKELAIAYTDTQLALGSELPMDAQRYAFSPDKYSHIIYRSAIVTEIIKHFGLDFEGITSMSFSNVRMDKFTNANGIVVPVAIVSMK